MYHKVNDRRPNTLSVSTAAFLEQQTYLQENCSVISLEALVRHLTHGEALPDRAVLLTFDDGYLDNLENAYPVLQSAGHSAVLFVATNFIEGGTLPHDRDLPTANPTLSWADLNAMDGVFEIGSHGESHRRLTTLPPEVARQEIVRSKELLEEALGKEVRAFSYPKGSVGDYGPEHVAAVEEAGYTVAFSTLPGGNDPTRGKFALRRHNVEDYGLGYFRALLDGSADLLALKDTQLGYRAKGYVNRIMGASEY